MFPTLRALAAGMMAASLVAGAAAAGPPTVSAPLTAQEKSDFDAAMSVAKPGEPTVLAMSNPAQRRFFLRQIRAAGFTPERYPQLFRVTEAAAKAPPPAVDRRPLSAGVIPVGRGNVQPIQTLTSLGTTNGVNYSASALSSVPDDPVFSILVVQLYDLDDSPIGKPAFVVSGAGHPASNLNAIATGVSMPGHARVRAVGVYFWQPSLSLDDHGRANSGLRSSEDAPPNFGLLQATGGVAPISITNLAPTPGAGQTVIKLCLGRTGLDCTYTPSGGSGSNVLMPIQGSISFADPISTDPATQSSTITMTNPNPPDGGGCSIANTTSFFGSPNTVINGGVISWNLDPAQFPPADGCLAVNSAAIYTFDIGLTVGTAPTEVFITNDPNIDPDPNVKKIAQLQVFFSCVAEGTRITLSDGSTVAVEALKAGQRVMVDASGRAERVDSKFKGHEVVPMVRLRTVGGRSLLLTDGHPVITPTGPVLAGLLQPGQKVMTRKGAETLVSVGREMFARPVWNLNVGKPPADLNDPAVTGARFFADGILVGDNIMQFVENRRNQQAQAMLTARRTPVEWQRDVLSAIEDAN